MSGGGNIVHLLQEAARERGGATALIEGQGPARRSLTYAGLWERVDACSRGLCERGLAPGDRAVVMIPMTLDLYVALLAVVKAGAAAIFVDPWVPMRRIAAFCRHAEPRAFLGIPRSHLLRLWEKELLRLPLTVTTGRRWGSWPARWTLRETESRAGDGHIVPRCETDTALITFTTGSSGEPKGANRTHGFLVAQHRALREAFGRPSGVDMPLFPVFALNNLACGAATLIPDLDFRHLARLDARRLLGQMRANQVESCTLSPSVLDRLAACVLTGREAPPPLSRILVGGAPVRDTQLECWRQAFPGVRLSVVYGSTEAEPVAHATLEERLATASQGGAICVGHPVPCIEARVLRLPTGVEEPAPGLDEEVAPGGIGELVVSGAHVCRDYFRNPTATAACKLHGKDGAVWHRMGDTGWLDEEGRFWLTGRVHTILRRSGALVHANLVEERARALLGPGQFAALGVPDATLGERIILVARLEEARLDATTALARLIDAGLPVDQVALRRRPLPMDPRHDTKVDYQALRQSLGLPGGRP